MSRTQQDEPIPAGPEKSLFFTTIRQQGAVAEFIDFHLKPGQHHTIALTDIREMLFDPSVGIVLFFGFGMVRIEGRNLQALHGLLCQRKVSEIREFSENAELFFEKEVLFIKKIHYESEHLQKMGF